MLRTLVLLAGTPGLLAAQMLAAMPVEAVRTGEFEERDLRESSGVARSRAMPGVLFSINDSGNPAEIFAIDTGGRALGRWVVPGVGNRDWEAIAIGPCPAGSCIYIADTGDNLERFETSTIYRLTEPARLERFRGADDGAALGLDSIVIRYPDGAHDAEAMWVDRSGTIFLATKGRRDGVRLYRIAGDAPLRRQGTPKPAREARLVQVLPISPNQLIGRWVTDAALSPDGRTVAIRTYTELFLFPVTGPGRLGTPRSCNVAGLEPQGEGVDWLDDRRLVITSEAGIGRAAGPIHVVSCGA